MRLLIFLSLAILFSTSAVASSEILVRVDEKGRKIFFNPVPKKIEIEESNISKSVFPQKYSNKATDYVPLIEKACRKYSVDPDLVKALIQVESAYNSKALSPAGAIGLMQLMPGTAQRFGVKQIYDPHENIHGGVQYLKFLLDLFKNDLALAVAAYNAGEGAVHRFQGIPRYTETQNYVRKVLTLYGKGGSLIGKRIKVESPKTIYKYVDAAGSTHFTTQRPKAGAIEEIKLAF